MKIKQEHGERPVLRTHIALCAGLLFIGSADADQVDDVVRAEMARQHIPGVSISVVKGGRIVKEKGYGIANVEHQVAVTPVTVFQSASVGKQFTAALTMLLVEDGKINLDAPVSTYLPSVPDTWAKITVRHLLTHTSGLPANDKSIDLHRDYSEDELLQAATKVSLQAAPGDQWIYSNLGYQVLGILCSNVGGKFYGDQLRERIFKPIDMKARIISERDIVPHRAAGYDRVNGRLFNQEWVSPTLNTTADGCLYMTAHDLARWSIALDEDKVLSSAIKDASWTPARLNDGNVIDYGFGWEIHSSNGHRRIEHNGAWQGFMSQISRFPGDKVAVIVLLNRSHARPGDIVDKIGAQYIPGLSSEHAAPPSASTFGLTPFFLRGSMNKWGVSDRMQKVDESTYEAVITLDAGIQEFKVGSEDWEAIDFGAAFDEPSTDLDKAKPMEFKGTNLMLQVPQLAQYAFRFDVRRPRNPLLTVRRSAGVR